MLKRNFIVIGVLVLGWLILNVYTTILWEIRDMASQLDVNTMILYHGIAIILCFVLGLLLEHQSLIQRLSHKEKLKTSFSFYLGLILLALALVPPVFYLVYLGSIHSPFPKGGVGINMVTGLFNQFSNVQAILSVKAGSLIVKGLNSKK